MQDAENSDLLRIDAVKDQVVPQHPPANPTIFVPWNEREGFWHVAKRFALIQKQPNEGKCAGGIIGCDVVADGLEISLGF